MIRFLMSLLFAGLLLGSAAPAKAAFSLQYVTDYESLLQNQDVLMWIPCPAGTTVVSGGWDVTISSGPHINIWVSRQVGNGWRIMGRNVGNGPEAGFSGYAVCASGVAGMGSYTSAVGPVNVASNAGNQVFALCPSGGIPTGGGFDSNFFRPTDLTVMASYPAYQNQWSTWEYNPTNTSKSYTTYITCTTGINGYVTPVYGTQLALRNGGAVGAVYCNVGDFAVGGGFINSLTSPWPSSSWPKVRGSGSFPTQNNNRRWNARAYNGNTVDWAFVTPVAQCLHVN